jgi:hypothetical protein
MEEILIEEKKYVSSRRAAELTGYAKDYVGQLCREGRVPARLVGRGWYVLESAIQDHRFGNPEEAPEEVAPVESPAVVEKEGFPKYVPVQPEVLPSINRLRDAGVTVREVASDGANHLHDSWRAWFDQTEGDKREVTEEARVEEAISPVEPEEEVPQGSKIVSHEPEEVVIPIRTFAPPERRRIDRRPRHSAASIIQTFGAIAAAAMVALAVVGSGYLDTYVLSHSQVQFVAGVALYDK